MNVLSLFDGMSCGQIALNRLGIKDYTYYASEIDKYAIQITQKNYPKTIQLGDIRNISGENYYDIDLLIGGSPCQGFSFAGKQLNFEDERSKLFFEYVRILELTEPKYFLLENVKMKKEYQDIISTYLFGIKPIKINSSLVSAQNRERLYWVGERVTIPCYGGGTKTKYIAVDIEQPQDKGIVLQDILEDKVDEKYYLTGRQVELKINSKFIASGGLENVKEKCSTIRAAMGMGGGTIPCIQVANIDIKGNDSIKRVYSPEGKSPTLTTMEGGHRQPKILLDKVRKLTPTECERLQTVPDGYTEGVSNSQRYKMLGNGWTVDVIVHILKQLIKY